MDFCFFVFLFFCDAIDRDHFGCLKKLFSEPFLLKENDCIGTQVRLKSPVQGSQIPSPVLTTF